jgi:hypothetical protein
VVDRARLESEAGERYRTTPKRLNAHALSDLTFQSVSRRARFAKLKDAERQRKNTDSPKPIVRKSASLTPRPAPTTAPTPTHPRRTPYPREDNPSWSRASSGQ